jgi:hypothetical protein
MTKEELEKEAREYLAEHSEYSEVFGQTFVAVDTLTAMVDFAEPREKQIEIDARQIRALQKQNGELTDKIAELKHQLGNLYEIIKRPYQFTAPKKIQMVEKAEQFLKEVEE